MPRAFAADQSGKASRRRNPGPGMDAFPGETAAWPARKDAGFIGFSDLPAFINKCMSGYSYSRIAASDIAGEISPDLFAAGCGNDRLAVALRLSPAISGKDVRPEKTGFISFSRPLVAKRG